MATFDSIQGKRGIRIKARIRKNGVVKCKTFANKSAAKAWALKEEAVLDAVAAGIQTEASRHTLCQAVTKYRAEILPSLAPETARKYSQHLEFWESRFGPVRLDGISPRMIASERDALTGDGKSPSTANRYLATLASVYKAASRRWHWLDTNPVRNVEKGREAQRDRFLSRDEVKRLLEACRKSESRDLFPAVLLSITTGGRQGEVLGLRWEYIDLDRGIAIVPKTKNGDARSLALVPEAVEILKDRKPEDATGWVFPSKSGERPMQLRTPWITALRRAEIENFRWHDLRHSVASFLAERGHSLKEIGSVLGHRSINTTSRYAHLTESHAHQLVQDMAVDVVGGSDDGR